MGLSNFYHVHRVHDQRDETSSFPNFKRGNTGGISSSSGERTVSLAVFHRKPRTLRWIFPTSTQQYARCGWQCIMKIGHGTRFSLSWRPFKSRINFSAFLESSPIFQTYLAPVDVDTLLMKLTIVPRYFPVPVTRWMTRILSPDIIYLCSDVSELLPWCYLCNFIFLRI